MGVVSLTAWRISWKMVIFEFLYIFSYLCIALGYNFLGFLLYILGPRRQLLKQNFPLLPFCFQDGHHRIFYGTSAYKSQLLLWICFKLCTVIDMTSSRNRIDFGQNKKNRWPLMFWNMTSIRNRIIKEQSFENHVYDGMGLINTRIQPLCIIL